MNIHFKKKLSKEHRDFLLELLDKYETAYAMTKPEREELYLWVADGNSPYDNPSLFYDEGGRPMDFISALREEEYMRQEHESMPPEEHAEFHRAQEKPEDDLLLTDAGNLAYPFI